MSEDKLGDLYNETVCQGHETTHADGIPAMASSHTGDQTAGATYRVGGSQHRALFVAPTTANYTFNARFNGEGELWLSPNADPRFAQRIVSSTEPDLGTESSEVCDDWTCVEGQCFRAFGRYSHTFDQAQYACEQFGGR